MPHGSGKLPVSGERDPLLAMQCREPKATVHAASAFHDIDEAIIITDAHHRIIDINPAFLALTGFTAEEVLGKSPSLFCLQWSSLDNSECNERTSQANDSCKAELSYRNRQGAVLPALISIKRVRNAQREISHHIVVITEFASLHLQRYQTGRAFNFDNLTGLPNQHLLSELIAKSLHQVHRHSGTLTICSLDIDHFKPINERLGQAIGDQLLAKFARRIGQQVQHNSILARIGGDEFVLLLHHAVDEAFLNTLLETIRQPFMVQGHSLQITVSLGVASYPNDNVDSDVLLRHANQAMYRAKQRGRDGFHIFDPNQDRELQLRQAHHHRFAQAIANDELRLHYQPQVDMSSGKVVGLEALIRWQHPKKGLLPPARFLPELEGSPLEIEAGEWVLEQALQQLHAWQRAGILLPVHVNISPDHLLSEAFTERLADKLKRDPLVPPGMLKLEVLETAAMNDIQAALGVMRRCQEMRIDFAIDDFGTGYSSLTHLRQLPVDLIKIDQSFVRDMLTDPDDMAIVESVIYMANRFRRPMLAEGVETLEHARALVTMGCHLAQGYGIARPMAPDKLPEWLIYWPKRSEWAALMHCP